MNKENKEKIKKELSQLGSSLPERPKKDPFGVPEGYFETLPHKIREEISSRHASRQAEVPAISLKRRLVTVMASLALIIALSVSFFIFQTGTKNGYLTGTEEYPDEEYFALTMDFDRGFFYDLILESEMTEEELKYGLHQDMDFYEDDELIESYLFERMDYYDLSVEEMLLADEEFEFPEN